MGWLSRLFTGEDEETRHARMRMAADRQDPRRTFVWGILAASYDLDPAYLPAHANEAVRQWYGVKSAGQIVEWTAANFAANRHVAYNQYRLCFLARAGFGAGLLDETTSWSLAIRHAAVAQQHYRDWGDFGRGYLEGHLSYRTEQGDPPNALATHRKNIGQRLEQTQRTVWVAVPWATPMGG